MRYRILTLMLLALAAPISSAGAAELLIEVARRGDGLELTATTGRKPLKVRVDSRMASRLMSIRFSVECMEQEDCRDQAHGPFEADRQILDAPQLADLLQTAGKEVLGPLSGAIRKASSLRIALPMDLLKLPLDALPIDGEPLYLQKPAVYVLDRRVSPARLTVGSGTSAILLSDPSTDPDRAVFELASRFPHTIKLDAKDADPASLPRATSPIAVISLHGRVGYDGGDFMLIPGERALPPSAIAGMRPPLVYLDSCNLGISPVYISALRSAGTKYLLAPVLSNEAGHSSTLTVREFFRHVVDGASPASALFETRKALHARYAEADPRMTLWRAYAFRLYALN